ncbi:hypothetical protein [Winogradskyella arenosi]|nr:hypothetical protein [Winogradskyella arenosi]
MYASERTTNIGKIYFINPPYEDLVLKLWKDVIFIEYHKKSSLTLSEITRSNLEKLETKLETVVVFKFWRKGVIIDPINKFEFPDTKTGMKLRADYFVMIANLALTCFGNQIDA